MLCDAAVSSNARACARRRALLAAASAALERRVLHRAIALHQDAMVWVHTALIKVSFAGTGFGSCAQLALRAVN
jgi:hypothetical protein